MLRLVAYDIREPKRLKRVAKICEDYGIRVQYSVFECDLDDERFGYLWAELAGAIDDEKDSLLCYPICRACASQVEGLGVVLRPGRPLLYVA